jgi:hypothetical protein
VLTLNKVEERVLERNIKSLNRECKTCITFLDRDIRKIEDEFNSKQVSMRYTSYSQTRIQQMNKQNQMLKNNYFSNLNKLQNFNVSKTSTPRSEDANKQPPSGQDRRVKKNLSANARLSNASHTLPLPNGRHALSASPQQHEQPRPRSAKATVNRPTRLSRPTVRSHFLTTLNADKVDYERDSPSSSSSSSSSLNNLSHTKTGDLQTNFDLDRTSVAGVSPLALLPAKAPISITRNKNAPNSTKRKKQRQQSASHTAENDEFDLTTTMTQSEYFGDVDGSSCDGRNEFAAISSIRVKNSNQSPTSIKSVPLTSSSSSIGSSTNSPISHLPQILPRKSPLMN